MFGEINFTKSDARVRVVFKPGDKWADIQIGTPPSVWLILTTEQALNLRKELEVVNNDN